MDPILNQLRCTTFFSEINFNIIHQYKPRYFKWFFTSEPPTRHIILVILMCATCFAKLTLLDHPNHILCRSKFMQPNIMKQWPAFCTEW